MKKKPPQDHDPTDWMALALEEAELAGQEDEVPIGAVIVCDGKIVGRGHNRREQNQDPLGHAELLAIQEAAQNLGSWRLDTCKIYVTLEPCPMCLGAIQQARLNGVIYGATDPKGGALSLGYRLHEDLRTHHRFEVEHLPIPECSEILSKFFRDKRRKKHTD